MGCILDMPKCNVIRKGERSYFEKINCSKNTYNNINGKYGIVYGMRRQCNLSGGGIQCQSGRKGDDICRFGGAFYLQRHGWKWVWGVPGIWHQSMLVGKSCWLQRCSYGTGNRSFLQ